MIFYLYIYMAYNDNKNEVFIKAGICYLKDNLLEVPDIKAVLNVIFALPDNTYEGGEIPYENETDYY